MSKLLVIYAIVGIALGFKVNAQEYLKEKPDFLTPCEIHSNFKSQCFSNSVQNLFANWGSGLGELKGIGSIDPFKIKRLRFSQRAEGVADIQLQLKNVLVSGMSKTQVTKSSIDPKDYTLHLQLNVPVSKLASNYKLRGSVLVLSLDGQGQLEMDLTDVNFNVIAKNNLVKRGDEYFFDIQSVNTDITSVGNFKIHLTNLFNGNKELEDSAHELFNGSWRILLDALRPGLTSTFDSVIKDRFKRVFSYIPARFFISDLP